MTNGWGRSNETGRWPHPTPVWVVAALLLGVGAFGTRAFWDYARRWTPLQRAFLGTYLRSTVLDAVGVKSAGRYQVLLIETPKERRIPLNEEVASAPREVEGGPSLVLTDAARQLGGRALIWTTGSFRPAALHTYLTRWVYMDRTVPDLLTPAAWTGLVTAFLALLVAIPRDVVRTRERRVGRRLRGPELVSITKFERLSQGNGMAFIQRTPRWLGWVPRALRRFYRPKVVRIPRRLESSHLLIMGDSGTGKSALIRQILGELKVRGDSAVVYDPALEYVGQFYEPDRGDRILNPLDARSPYWNPCDEWRHEAEALTLAASLFPDRPNENPFFTEAPRRIFAHLLLRTKTPQELISCLSNDQELNRLLAGTQYASMVDREAPAQRSGVLAALNMVADTLKLLPPESETTSRWTATEWSVDRRGWLFLTSTPETRQRLVPLTSLWLDMLVLRLMNQGIPGRRPTWFILDELASLQRLPQLHTAITENRKSNNPVVLGFQGRSQLETRYGHDAETILSQPATKIFLRTSEPRAAKWIADTIGDVEIERLRESRSSGRGAQQNYGLERQMEPLIMASEITGLPSLRGILKLGNLVVRMEIPYPNQPLVETPFVERPGWGRSRAATTAANVPTNPEESRSQNKGETHGETLRIAANKVGQDR